MPRTPMGIYYPNSDTNIQESIQAMMESIDTVVKALSDASDTVDTPDGISIYGPSTNVASAATVSVDFTGGSIEFDTGGYWSAGNPTRYTIDTGWWIVIARGNAYPSTGSVDAFDIAIRSNSNTVVAQHQMSNASDEAGVITGGLCCKSDTTDYLWMEMTYVGTAGGTATVPVPVMGAIKIGDL